MARQLFTWVTNLALACVLVLLAQHPLSLAQETDAAATDDTTPNTGPREIVIPLTGTAVLQTMPDLQVHPAQFDTGLVDIGETVNKKIQLTHVGAADSDPIYFEGISLFGVNASEYSIDLSGFMGLIPGESVDLNITFTPYFPGKKNAGIRMEIAGSSSPFVVMIGGSARYPLTSDLVAYQEEVKLGQVLQDVATSKTVKIGNSAEESDAPVINLLSASLSGDTPDAFEVAFSPTTLVPGQDITMKVTMKSGIVGHKEALLTIEHDGNNGPVEVIVSGDVVEPQAVPVNFTVSQVSGPNIIRGTSLQFGPDGRLYVSQMDGKILIFNVTRTGKNNYKATLDDTINSVYNMPNRNDDGSLNGSIKGRLVTGILVTGSAAKPVIYVQSSDPRQGGGPSGVDKNLDTNSGILHKLTANGGGWSKVDLVRGLPRSEENHQGNGLAMLGNKLLLSLGGHTNMGAPSNNFAEITEYALSAAILEIDLNAIGNNTYDLPTLDDEDRAGANDANDPFGGNNGKNQAILEKNGPVQIYAPGFRNAYDLVLTESGKLYTIDNGPNSGWGNVPVGNCTNKYADGGKTYGDSLHHVKSKGYYGGHPNPTRGNKNNKFNDSNPQTPVEIGANSKECDYKIPKTQNGALTEFGSSTNGLDEYTATNFGGSMKGDLVAVGFGKKLYRLQLNGTGTQLTSKSVLKSGFGTVLLDVVAQGDEGPFPGTIWIVDNSAENLFVLEPSDF